MLVPVGLRMGAVVGCDVRLEGGVGAVGDGEGYAFEAHAADEGLAANAGVGANVRVVVVIIVITFGRLQAGREQMRGASPLIAIRL